MKRRIFCPADFCKNIENAMDYAIDLFKTKPSNFYILNTVNVEPISMERVTLRDLEESKSKLTVGLINILDRFPIVDNYVKHKFHRASQSGASFEIMKDLIEKQDIDIVIMDNKEI